MVPYDDRESGSKYKNCFGLCHYLRINEEKISLIKAVEGLPFEERWSLGSAYWYELPSWNKPDEVRAFTACLIAEMGEEEFMKVMGA